MRPETILKQPSEVLHRPITFSGVSTVTELHSVEVVARGLVAGAAELGVVPQLFVGAVTLAISGGTDGERYLITAIADDADGQRVETELEIAVIDMAWAMPDGGAPYLSIADFIERFTLEEVMTMTDTGKGFIDRGLLVGALINAQAVADARRLVEAATGGAERFEGRLIETMHVEEARALIKGEAGILAKLEKPSAITELDAIVAAADAIMVARGDLGVEMPPEDVPVLQRRIINACRMAGKPVVVATQMLDSMVERPVPTRAEASDVATAVYSGADAVMLSAETAVGDYPVESVEMMNRIIERVERDPVYREGMEAQRQKPEPTTADAVATAAAQMAKTLNVNAIATYTTS